MRGEELWNINGTSQFKKALKVFLMGVLAFACLVLLSGILLSLSHLLQYGFSAANLNLVGNFLWKLKSDPFKVWEAYGAWMRMFSQAAGRGVLTLGMLLPLLSPMIVIAITIWVFYRKPRRRWTFRLENHLADDEIVEKIGLFNGFLMFLGKFNERVLKLNRTYSVFALGESGMGKTSGLAIPSILESDKACVVAIDDSGVLAKYTSGYRAKFGKVFYFDWRLRDNPEKGEYWPRWNPLSLRNLPKGGNKRERYILALAKSLLAQDRTVSEENYWDRLSHIALEGLLQFFIAKVEQAGANDYFLSKIMEKGSVFREDRELLLSYYVLMPESVAGQMVALIKDNQLNYENYLPVGSWGGIPEEWQGREMCLPMFTDFLIQRYFLILQNVESKDVDAWKILLEEFLEEATLFAYHPRVSQALRQLYYLSKKQRNIVFPMVLKPLTNFRNKTVRERTCLSDFYLRQSRGIKTPQGLWQVSTIYNVYNNDFMSRFFVDMLVEDALIVHRNAGGYPLLFVMDDLAKLPRFSSLVDGVRAGLEANLSFLLINNDLAKVQEIYGVDRLENIISNATYKLITAANNQNMSAQLEHIAVYGTKSVQIPKLDHNDVMNMKNGLADASYYRRIAASLGSEDNEEIFERGCHLLLAEGFYHRPVKALSTFFLNDGEMIEKSAHRPNCFVALDVLQRRNPEDLNPPLLIEVLKNSGIKIKDGDDVDEFIDESFDEAIEYSQLMPDRESALTEEIIERWESREPQMKTSSEIRQNDDWWMTEKSFEVLPENTAEAEMVPDQEVESGESYENAAVENDVNQTVKTPKSYDPEDPLG